MCARDHSGEAYFDIFSCKAFDESIALDVIDRFFEPDLCEKRSLTRQAPRSKTEKSEADGQPKANARLAG